MKFSAPKGFNARAHNLAFALLDMTPNAHYPVDPEGLHNILVDIYGKPHIDVKRTAGIVTLIRAARVTNKWEKNPLNDAILIASEQENVQDQAFYIWGVLNKGATHPEKFPPADAPEDAPSRQVFSAQCLDANDHYEEMAREYQYAVKQMNACAAKNTPAQTSDVVPPGSSPGDVEIELSPQAEQFPCFNEGYAVGVAQAAATFALDSAILTCGGSLPPD